MSYWATPGGGVEPGETFEDAAIRELKEETGIVVSEVGSPVARREVVFQLSDGEKVLEEERYFHIATASAQISLDGWTACERESMTEHRWWTPAELERTDERISPENLLLLWQEFAAPLCGIEAKE